MTNKILQFDKMGRGGVQVIFHVVSRGGGGHWILILLGGGGVIQNFDDGLKFQLPPPHPPPDT